MKLLNLGCGSRYCMDPDWINVDFVSHSKDVIAHNLLEGIPFSDNYFDLVYHSHLLEHFPKAESYIFIKECYRVLKPGGIIRIVVPDLEEITKTYIQQLELALQGHQEAASNYDWMMLEMYDQTVRNYSGGEMGKLYAQGSISNPDFIYKRVGHRITKKTKTEVNTIHATPLLILIKDTAKQFIRKILALPTEINFRNLLLRLILRKEYKFYEVGKFRFSGEIHQWMYDRFSLSRLLTDNGFKEPRVCKAWESHLPQWTSFNLDTNQDGTKYKPDSFYMEAIK